MEIVNIDNIGKFKKAKGIYVHLNEDIKVAYVGKSVDLKNRMNQYFTGRGHSDLINDFVKLDNTHTFIIKTFEYICDIDLRIMEDIYRCEFEAYGYDMLNVSETMSETTRSFINQKFSLKEYCYNRGDIEKSTIIDTSIVGKFRTELINKLLRCDLFIDDVDKETSKVLKVIKKIKENNVLYENIDIGFSFNNCEYDNRYYLDRFYSMIGINYYRYCNFNKFKYVEDARNKIKDICRTKYGNFDDLPKSSKIVRMCHIAKENNIDILYMFDDYKKYINNN